MTRNLCLFVFFLLTISYSVDLAGQDQASETKKGDGEWIQLFNGKNLDGWTPKIRYHDLGDNYKNTFRVKDGVMQVGFEGYDKFNETFGHIFYPLRIPLYRSTVSWRPGLGTA